MQLIGHSTLPEELTSPDFREFAKHYPDPILFVDDPTHWPQEKDPSTGIHVAGEYIPSHPPSWYLEHGIKHFVPSSHPNFLSEIQVAAQMIQERNGPLPTNLEFYLTQPIIQEKAWQLNSSRQKSSLISESSDFFSSLETLYIPHEILLLIVDELITNALFNAPIDSSGQPLNRGLNRNQEVTCDRPARLQIAASQSHLAIAITDQYGSLDIKSLFLRLKETYSEDDVTVRENGCGAGIGYRLILEYAASLSLGVKCSEQTIAVIKIPLATRTKKICEMAKCLHIF